MRKSANGVVETAGFTSPLAMPPGTYTPLETDASAAGVTVAADVDAVITIIGLSTHQRNAIIALQRICVSIVYP